MKQSTNVNVVINKPTRKPTKRKQTKQLDKESSFQSVPNIITNITNPASVPTNYQLPIYYQTKQVPTPFLANTPEVVSVSQPVGSPNENNQIPVETKKVRIDSTQLSGAVPASFIPQEAPALIKTGGNFNLEEEVAFQKRINERAKKRLEEITTYTPPVQNDSGSATEVQGEYFTEAEAIPVKPRRKYEYKPETIARRKAKKEEKLQQQQQNVNPAEIEPEPQNINLLEEVSVIEGLPTISITGTKIIKKKSRTQKRRERLEKESKKYGGASIRSFFGNRKNEDV